MQNLENEISNLRNLPPSENGLLSEQRAEGLQFVVRAKQGQSIDDVTEQFHTHLHQDFEVELLFPESQTQKLTAKDATEFPLYESGFVARLPGVAFEDLSVHSFDLAHKIRDAAGFVEVWPQHITQNPTGDFIVANPKDGPTEDIENGWPLGTMNVVEAWKQLPKGRGNGVVIGQPDTGWADHEIWGPNRTVTYGLALPGRNFLHNEEESDATDKFDENRSRGFTPGHGTLAASVATAPGGLVETRAGVWKYLTPGRMTGIAPEAKIMPLRCTRSVAIHVTVVRLARAIKFAADNGCQVISMSLGGYFLRSILLEPICYALKKNCIIVASSGTWTPSQPKICVEPAKYPEVIGVAGTNGGRETWKGSGWIPAGSVDISAPAGPGLPAAYRYKDGPLNTYYGNGTGTTYSAPLVAGAAALWLAKHYPNGFDGPQGSAQQTFRKHLQTTAKPGPNWNAEHYGPGIVDANALVSRKPSEFEPAMLREPTTTIDDLAFSLGIDDSDRTQNLFHHVVKDQNLARWAGEISTILNRNFDIGRVIDQMVRSLDAKDARSVSEFNDTVRSALLPMASDALREQLV